VRAPAARGRVAGLPQPEPEARDLLAQLDDLEPLGSGILRFAGGRTLKVNDLDRTIWPALKFTKADLFRYYLGVAPYILPALEDRPLSFKRFPKGLHAPETFHQRIKWKVPDGVRVEPVKARDKVFEPRLIGGSLLTLLYGVQLDFISMDPWLSRIGTPDSPDAALIDVDPMPDVPFSHVLDVARWLHDLLERAGVTAFAKTSGKAGLHLVIPLAPGTDYRTARVLAETFARRVAHAHPTIATVERTIAARRDRVYLDCDQNMRAKTMAAPYAARHSAFAGVSAPVTWTEVHAGIRPEDFTVRTILARLAEVGDLWAAVRAAPGVDVTNLYRRWLR
jgi:bifunctional non-homologous end joining protein LigD